MRARIGRGQYLYRLEMDEPGCAAPRLVEFEAHGAGCALLAIRRSGTERMVKIFEEGRPLARVRALPGGEACWVNPPTLRPM